MEQLLSQYNGRLYSKKELEKWDLSNVIKKQISWEEFDYFFLTASKEEEHGQKHVHLTIYPSKFPIINLLEVEVPKILPKILHRTLEILKENNSNILTSTGFCTNSNMCHFGVFFSTPDKAISKPILVKMKDLKEVKSIKVFSYTCDGCFEV